MNWIELNNYLFVLLKEKKKNELNWIMKEKRIYVLKEWIMYFINDLLFI